MSAPVLLFYFLKMLRNKSQRKHTSSLPTPLTIPSTPLQVNRIMISPDYGIHLGMTNDTITQKKGTFDNLTK